MANSISPERLTKIKMANKYKKSLLARAKAMPMKTERTTMKVTDELIELAVAYAKHEVSAPQIEKVLGVKKGCADSRMNSAIKSAIRNGSLVLK